jgi:hypothetical protein
MALIYSCDGVTSQKYSKIGPIEAPLPFKNITYFETWLRMTYYPIALVKNTECLGIFSTENRFERACQKHADSQNTSDFEEFLRGKILSHNHPSDSTLSCSDILVWANLEMKEIRAVTDLWTYSIKPIKHTWPDPELIIDEIRNICPSIACSQSKNTHELRHECYQTLAKKGLFEYSKTYPY